MDKDFSNLLVDALDNLLNVVEEMDKRTVRIEDKFNISNSFQEFKILRMKEEISSLRTLIEHKEEEEDNISEKNNAFDKSEKDVETFEGVVYTKNMNGEDSVDIVAEGWELFTDTLLKHSGKYVRITMEIQKDR